MALVRAEFQPLICLPTVTYSAGRRHVGLFLKFPVCCETFRENQLIIKSRNDMPGLDDTPQNHEVEYRQYMYA